MGIIWDITLCAGGCNKIVSVSGSYGATQIKEGDTLNPVDQSDKYYCDDCKNGKKL